MATQPGTRDDKSSLGSAQGKGIADGLEKAVDSFFTVLKNTKTDDDLRKLLESHLLHVVGDRVMNLKNLNDKHKHAIIAGITYRMLVHMIVTFPKELLKDIDAYT